MLKVCSLKGELYGFSALAQTLSERFIKDRFINYYRNGASMISVKPLPLGKANINGILITADDRNPTLLLTGYCTDIAPLPKQQTIGSDR